MVRSKKVKANAPAKLVGTVWRERVREGHEARQGMVRLSDRSSGMVTLHISNRKRGCRTETEVKVETLLSKWKLVEPKAVS